MAVCRRGLRPQVVEGRSKVVVWRGGDCRFDPDRGENLPDGRIYQNYFPRVFFVKQTLYLSAGSRPESLGRRRSECGSCFRGVAHLYFALFCSVLYWFVTPQNDLLILMA